VQEDLNRRPRLVVSDATCKCEKLLLDPNPAADQYALSPVRVHEWKDSTGRTWRGGLMLPAHYVAGKRYPLIVQNHGFDPNQFLMDGPEDMHTAFAARAFAQAGMAVLQIEEKPDVEGSASQARVYADAYHSGIESLIQAGIADEQRVGIIGFSSTGLGVVQLLADYPGTIAAALIADASMNGYMTQLDNVDLLQDFKAQSDAAGLASPLSMSILEWWKENPLPRIAGASAAVLLQTIDAGATVHEWEIYALLRGRHKPVDLVYLPFGSHSLFNPRERFVSQGSSVEWFKLWLQMSRGERADAAGLVRAWGEIRRRFAQ
jgi:dipeptidyl aminopeptidase/acylaminoacyl peptidase